MNCALSAITEVEVSDIVGGAVFVAEVGRKPGVPVLPEQQVRLPCWQVQAHAGVTEVKRKTDLELIGNLDADGGRKVSEQSESAPLLKEPARIVLRPV